jgi:hypothetical protein
MAENREIKKKIYPIFPVYRSQNPTDWPFYFLIFHLFTAKNNLQIKSVSIKKQMSLENLQQPKKFLFKSRRKSQFYKLTESLSVRLKTFKQQLVYLK